MCTTGGTPEPGLGMYALQGQTHEHHNGPTHNTFVYDYTINDTLNMAMPMSSLMC